MTEILPPRSARVFGPIIVVAGVACAVAGVASVDLRNLALSGVAGALFPILIGGMLVTGGRMLWSPRGGLRAGGGRVALGGDGKGDEVDAEAAAILVHEHVERWDEHEHATWVCEAIAPGGLRLLLAEAEDEHGLKHVAHEVAGAAGLGAPIEEAPSFEPLDSGPVPGAVTTGDSGFAVHVGVGGRLAAALLTGGLAMVPVGVVLFMDVGNNNVLGFLFGPLLTLLGVALLAVPTVKAGLVETLVRDGDRLRHGYRVFGMRFGASELTLGLGAYVRVRQRGLLGASLEIVSAGRVHHVAGGVHRSTSLKPAELIWLGRRVAALVQTALHTPS